MNSFDDILKFQQFTITHDYNDNLIEFMRLSKKQFQFDNLQDFVYSRMSFYQLNENEALFLDIINTRVAIPCKFDMSHNGVNCSIKDHLLGIGCLDCMNPSNLFPMED